MRKYPLIAQEDQEWVPIIPIPKKVVFPNLLTHKYLKYMNDYLITLTSFSYVNKKNQTIGYVVQFKDETNNINYLRTLTYCQAELGEVSWYYRVFPSPYSLYNLYEIISNPSKKVILVENEESASLAQYLFPNYVVSTWYKGIDSDITKVDWSPLLGREVIIWPNADSVGTEITLTLKNYLPKFGIKSLRTVTPSFSKAIMPYGWDFSDRLPIEWQNIDLNLILDNATILYYTEDYLGMINPNPIL